MTRFRSVVFDVDSTLSTLEGIDWLAERRAPEVAVAVAELTRQAMDGSLPIDALYGRRLDLVRPTRAEIEALAEAYGATGVAGAGRAIERLRGAGLRLVIVSGGLREAILPFVARLGFAPDVVHAVGIRHHADGSYAGWDVSSPLATRVGKGTVLSGLALPAPVLGVGDGTTDVAMRDAGATFAAFTGVAYRPAVVARADHVVATFEELLDLVLT